MEASVQTIYKVERRAASTDLHTSVSKPSAFEYIRHVCPQSRDTAIPCKDMEFGRERWDSTRCKAWSIRGGEAEGMPLRDPGAEP